MEQSPTLTRHLALGSFVLAMRLPSGALAEGFGVAEERARRLGRTHREFARSRAAISDGFGNTMTQLIECS